ncbi:MAG TPA: SpoIIE family protein phosphatase [Candidatus Polarisedimenticolia bacterium]|nr:SpoIIE family protein phosphatase [Candidatus Polarisedimenticolia bacterium]
MTARSEGVLVATVDGVGHGPEAALASDLAIRVAEEHAARPLPEILEACHQSLQRTRGATLSIARWIAERQSLEWVGVGNVEGLVAHHSVGGGVVHERLLLRAGLVGVTLPPLKVATLLLPFESRLIFATDGVAGDFAEGIDPRDPPQVLADRILARSLKREDDALVLVAHLGG